MNLNLKFFVVLLCCLFFFFGCQEKAELHPVDSTNPISSEVAPAERPVTDDVVTDDELETSVQGQLLALVDTQEEAEEIAALYGIELLSFSDGVAVYYTEEDVSSVIARGKENGWVELSENNLHTLN